MAFGAPGRCRCNFQFSVGATSLTTGTWTDVDALDFASPDTTGVTGLRDGNTLRTAVSASIDGLALAPGATLWIRWADFNASGADDGLAIDDFSLTPAALFTGQPVVISQVYGGGGNSGAPLTNDFVELFNRSPVPVSLTGMSIQYASATGSGNFGASASQLVTLAGTLEPGQYCRWGTPCRLPVRIPGEVVRFALTMSGWYSNASTDAQHFSR